MRLPAIGLLIVAATGVAFAQGPTNDGLPQMAYQPNGDPRAFYPIGYQCPPRAGGLVEIVKMNGIGARVRFHVTFEGEAVTNVSLQRAWRDTPFQSWHEFGNPKKKPEGENERKLLEQILWDAEAIRMAVCMGVPTTREKYDKIIEYNRTHLKPTRLD